MVQIKRGFLAWISRLYNLLTSSEPKSTRTGDTRPSRNTDEDNNNDKTATEGSTSIRPVSHRLLFFRPPSLHRETPITNLFRTALSNSSQRAHFPFLRLPTELRLQVYKHLLPLAETKSVGIIRVSRLIHLEAVQLFYANTPLHLTTPLPERDIRPPLLIGTRNASWLKHLSWTWNFEKDLTAAVQAGNTSAYVRIQGNLIAFDISLIATCCASLKSLTLTFPPPATKSVVAGRSDGCRDADIFWKWKPVRQAVGTVKSLVELVVWNTWAVEEVEKLARGLGAGTVSVGWGKGFKHAVKWRRRRRLRTRGWDVEIAEGWPPVVLARRGLAVKAM